MRLTRDPTPRLTLEFRKAMVVYDLQNVSGVGQVKGSSRLQLLSLLNTFCFSYSALCVLYIYIYIYIIFISNVFH
jgi:hypothetical protein